MSRLLRAELLKLRAARTTWWTLAAMLVLTAAALTINAINNVAKIGMIRQTPAPDIQGMSLAELYSLAVGGWENVALAASAADLYTSGQFAGLLVAMLLGVYVLAGEFARGTIATTFLIEPRRHRVLAAKLVVAVGGSQILWLLTTLMSVPAGFMVLRSQGLGGYLDNALVLRSLWLNAAAFAVWTLLGFGLGCLLRRLTVSIIVAMLLYLSSFTATQMIFGGGSKSSEASGWDWSVLVPSIASRRLVDAFYSAGEIPSWQGATVLVGYGVVTSLAGLWLLRRRDIA